MNVLGPFAFWVVLGGSFATIALYAFYRMSQRDAVPASETDAGACTLEIVHMA
ncbi:hypothetical protein [Roseovarius nitratireducens]|uniref:hypothetical protein n=1 Tax=Roseovarius nitratireducens TaxID=2044597 RepID=UPI003F6D69C6